MREWVISEENNFVQVKIKISKIKTEVGCSEQHLALEAKIPDTAVVDNN